MHFLPLSLCVHVTVLVSETVMKYFKSSERRSSSGKMITSVGSLEKYREGEVGEIKTIVYR